MSHSICEGFGSRVIHGGNTKDRGYRSLNMPVYQTSTFYFDSCEDGGKAYLQPLRGVASDGNLARSELDFRPVGTDLFRVSGDGKEAGTP